MHLLLRVEVVFTLHSGILAEKMLFGMVAQTIGGVAVQGTAKSTT